MISLNIAIKSEHIKRYGYRQARMETIVLEASVNQDKGAADVREILARKTGSHPDNHELYVIDDTLCIAFSDHTMRVGFGPKVESW